MKKFELKDLGLKLDELKGEQKSFMTNIGNMMLDVINKSLEGVITEDDVKTKFDKINETLKSVDSEKFNQVVTDNETLIEQVKTLGESIDKLKSKGLSMETINKFDDQLNEMLDSEKFKEFAEGKTRKSGEFAGFSLKDVVNMTSNYTGTALTTQQQSVVVSQVGNKKLHVRDILTVLNGDPQYPNLAFAQVYDFDRNAAYVTENGNLPESSIKVKEQNTSVKRLGTYMKISKRMLKSRVYIRSYILNMLPEAVYMAEDWNILFGDGAGENLEGITNQTGVKSIESILSTSIVSGNAGSIKSIKGANSNADTIIEFTNPQELILDGMKFKGTGAAVISALNSACDIVKMNDREILLKGVAYSGAETAKATMTWVVTNGAYQSISTPNSEDVIKTAFAVMTFAQYIANAIVLNPLTVNAIESEKDTQGHNLGIVTMVNGVKYVAGRPIIEYPGIPMGKYLLGDFKKAASLVDYTSLSLEWAEDVDSKIANQVVLIAQEEVILPVYMPWAFAYGDLATLKTAITKS